MSEDLKLFFGVLFFIAILLVSLVVIVSVLGAFAEYNTCQNMVEIHEDYEFQWLLFGGCRVKLDSGYWLHYQDMKYIEGNIILENE